MTSSSWVAPWHDDRAAPNGRPVAENFRAWFAPAPLLMPTATDWC